LILTTVVSLAGGLVGGFFMAMWLRGRALDNEIRVAYVLATAQTELGGFDIIEQAKVGSGSVYPILARFEYLGMVTSRWGEANGRKRRFYRWSAGPLQIPEKGSQ
jgi:hypothetical protein